MAKKKNLKVNIDLKALQDLEKNLEEKFFVKVGILAGKASESHENGISNLELGLVHEFGSITKNIPQRSFLRFPIEFKGKAITKLIAKNKDKIKEAIVSTGLKGIYVNLGLIAEKVIQQAFESGGFGQWEDISEKTKKAKKSDTILVDTAQLRRSITSKVMRKNKK